MPIAAAAARVIFTVDVDAGYPASDLPGLRQIETAACRLIDCFRRRQLLATWALGHLGASSLARRLVDAGHELGVLGETAWLGAGIHRQRSAGELAQRCAALAAAGGHVSSLLIHEGPVELPLDVMARHGIRCVRPAAASCPPARRWQALLGWKRGKTTESSVRALRHGIWELSSGPRVPAPNLRRTLRSLAKATAGPMPITIDLPRLARGAEADWSAVESISEHAGQLRHGDQLDVQTMSGWLATNKGALRIPARSILHRAA